jgi:hypothetical protein
MATVTASTPRPQLVRRDKLICKGCGREVARRARQQRYCSARCKEKGRTRVRKAALAPAPRAPAHRAIESNKINALQRAKTLSTHRIIAPAAVLDAEVLDRSWQPAVSSDGVTIETSRLRARALVERQL